jgi:RNA polymerase sigma-70 factor, ECF subfamily
MDTRNQRKLAKMYNNYADDIYRYLYAHGGDKELAEDLMADTFMRALKNIETFDFKQPRAWLYTIARNLLRDHWKKKSTLSLNEDLEIVDESDSVEEIVEKSLRANRLKSALDKLPSKESEVIKLRFVQNLSAKEVALVLNISAENVRIIQHRALKKMKGEI